MSSLNTVDRADEAAHATRFRGAQTQEPDRVGGVAVVIELGRRSIAAHRGVVRTTSPSSRTWPSSSPSRSARPTVPRCLPEAPEEALAVVDRPAVDRHAAHDLHAHPERDRATEPRELGAEGRQRKVSRRERSEGLARRARRARRRLELRDLRAVELHDQIALAREVGRLPGRLRTDRSARRPFVRAQQEVQSLPGHGLVGARHRPRSVQRSARTVAPAALASRALARTKNRLAPSRKAASAGGVRPSATTSLKEPTMTDAFTPAENLSSFRRIAAAMWKRPSDPSIYGSMDVDVTEDAPVHRPLPGRDRPPPER
jgi:hypothetical protein